MKGLVAAGIAAVTAVAVAIPVTAAVTGREESTPPAPSQVSQAAPAAVEWDNSGEAKQGGLNAEPCVSAVDIVKNFNVDASRVGSGKVTIGGWEVNFDSGWVKSHPSNASLTSRFHSMAWLIPDSPEGIPAAVDLFVKRGKEGKDPGSSIGKDSLSQYGWNESGVTLRLRTAACLYLVADKDQRKEMRPSIDALVAAAKDSGRYWGPPRSKPHNHGVMQDRALLDMSRITGDRSLTSFAEGRLRTQLDGMYDSCGVQREQSNGYQHFHASLWSQIARRVESPSLKRNIEKTIDRILYAAHAFTWPDGTTPRIGDGISVTLGDIEPVQRDLFFNCPTYGWFSWRSTDRGVQQQVIARYGPATFLHGHSDKGSVVWWAKPSGGTGVPVLADRGLPGKNRDARYTYAVSPEAHSVLLWPGGNDLRMSGKANMTAGKGNLDMSGSNRSGTWTRHVVFLKGQSVLRISDNVTSRGSVTQNMPLDPTWSPAGKPGVFSSNTGETLNITCSTKSGSRITPTMKKVVDYQLDEPRDSWTVRCSASGGVDSRLEVSR